MSKRHDTTMSKRHDTTMSKRHDTTMSKRHDATKVVHAGKAPPEQGQPFSGGPVFASTYHLSGDPTTSSYTYGRIHNPTWTAFEGALGELEGGLALAFASGMAAFSAVLGTLRPGETAVFPSDSYYLGRVLSTGYFGEMGIKVRMAPTAGNAQAEVLEGAKLLWLETPSNPGLEVCDVQSLCNLAHQKGLLVALDNTTPTLLGQKPLELGADFSVASDTKALSGHSDLLMGHVAVKDPQLLARLHTWRTQIGAVPGPMEVWLAHRSLATLDVRLERMNHNALMVAEFLSQHPKVEAVRYPGLASDPSYPIAAAQMRSFGPVLSLTLSNRRAAEQFLSACELVLEATSFGGVHTSAERRGRWGGDAVPEGFIRMSVGLEKAEDLLEDMTQALQQVDGG